MKYEDFSWNGQLASSFGIVVTEQVQYSRPAERLDQVTVPGRPGVLTLSATPTWETVTYAPVCALRPEADRERIFSWLRGSGLVVFGSMPTFAYEARLVNQIDYKSVFEDSGGYMTFAPVFECQPFRRLAVTEPEIQAKNGGMIFNPGTVDARPRIHLSGDGDVQLTVGETLVQLLGVEKDIVLDCEAQEALSLDGSRLLNAQMSGDFPTLPPGASMISWSGNVYGVAITPRWRWL